MNFSRVWSVAVSGRSGSRVLIVSACTSGEAADMAEQFLEDSAGHRQYDVDSVTMHDGCGVVAEAQGTLLPCGIVVR